MWPLLLDYSRDDCKRMMRRFELEAYSSVVTALRAQGDLNKDKRKILQDLAAHLSISLERHRAEVRRAVNDERLNTIAHYISGPNTSLEWTIEGRRLIPLMPRLVPQTAFTTVANTMANIQSAKNLTMNAPSTTGTRYAESNFEESFQSPKRRRIDSQSQMSVQGPPTIVPIKTSIHGQHMLQSVPTVTSLSPSHRFITQSPNSKASNIQRSFISSGNAYAMSTPSNVNVPTSISGGTVAPTRVIFVSSTPTTSATILTATTKQSSTPFPIITRPTIGSVPRPAVHVTSPRSSITKGTRQTTPTTVVGVIGVTGSAKQIKTSAIKSPVTLTASSNVAALTTIPFPQGTKVFTKTGGQQQVVVFPVNQKPIAMPLNQTSKGFTSSSGNIASQTIIYQQSSSNSKTVQKVQTPNLIIMQPKQIVKTTKTPLPSGAVTLTKSFSNQQNRPLFAAKKTSTISKDNESLPDSNVSTECEDDKPSSSSSIVNIQDYSSKTIKTITAKKIQEINIPIPDLSESEIITIDTSSETLKGLVKSGQLPSELMELVKAAVEKRDASTSKSSIVLTEEKKDHDQDINVQIQITDETKEDNVYDNDNDDGINDDESVPKSDTITDTQFSNDC